MDTLQSHRKRLQELLTKLALRAHDCPGLYAVKSELDFLNLASDDRIKNFIRLEDLANMQQTPLVELCHCLETLWRNPALSHQLLAQSLLRHHPVDLHTHTQKKSAAWTWHEFVLKQANQLTETTCQQKHLT